MKDRIDLLEKKIEAPIEEAKKQKKNAKKEKNERYFKGQRDALKRVLVDVKNLREEGESQATIEENTSAEDAAETPPLSDDAEALLKAALSKEIVTRKISVYFHKSFPKGKVQGKNKVLNLLEDKDIAAAIRQQMADVEKKQALEDANGTEISV